MTGRTGVVVVTVVVGLATGCSSASAPPPSPSASPPSATASSTSPSSTSPSPSPSAPATPSARVTGTVASGLTTPWGIAFLPDGSALVGERDTAKVLLVRPGSQHLVGTVPGVVSNGQQGGEGGLLGLAVSPSYATDHLIYAYMSTAADNRIVRMTYTGGRLGRPSPILTGIPHGLHHNGGRLAFGPDGMLYASTGEGGVPARAQDKGSLGGKILRMTPEGRAAPGNPFPGSVVWSYGHRNVEGLAFDSAGRLWATEFGDKAWDELNLILPGRNYGWPATQGRTDHPGYTSPKAQWHTDDAGPSGIAVIGSVAWIGALTGHRLWRVPLDGPSAGTPKAFFVDTYGRLRTAVAAPDGSLWLTTSNTDGRGSPRPGDDRILRLTVS